MTRSGIQTILRELQVTQTGVFSGAEDTAFYGLLPAFQDLETGETHLSLDADGSLATTHLPHGLPASWVTQRDEQGQVVAVKASIIAGYLRGGRFFSQEQWVARGCDA